MAPHCPSTKVCSSPHPLPSELISPILCSRCGPSPHSALCLMLSTWFLHCIPSSPCWRVAYSMSPLPNPMLLSTCPSLAPAPLLPPRHPASRIPPTSFEIQLSFLLPHCSQKGSVAFGPPVSCGLDLELPPTIYPLLQRRPAVVPPLASQFGKVVLGPCVPATRE